MKDIAPLGYKDHGLAANALDTSDTDLAANLRAWPGVRGLYLPDSVASYQAGGKTYLVTANDCLFYTSDAADDPPYIEYVRLRRL